MQKKNRHRKPLFIVLHLFLLLSAALLLKGCSTVSGGEIRVGMVSDHVPWENKLSETEAEGISIDLANDFSKFTGRPVKIYWFEQALLYKALADGKVDCILSSAPITDDYQKLYLMSDPYIKTYPILLIRKDSPVVSKNQLNAQSTTIAVIDPSKTADTIRSEYSNATILSFDSRSEALEALLAAKCDVLVDDPLSVFYLHSQSVDQTRINPAPLTDKFQYLTVYMPAGAENLRQQWNDFFSQTRKEGGFDKLTEKYVQPYSDLMLEYNIQITL